MARRRDGSALRSRRRRCWDDGRGCGRGRRRHQLFLLRLRRRWGWELRWWTVAPAVLLDSLRLRHGWGVQPIVWRRRAHVDRRRGQVGRARTVVDWEEEAVFLLRRVPFLRLARKDVDHSGRRGEPRHVSQSGGASETTRASATRSVRRCSVFRDTVSILYVGLSVMVRCSETCMSKQVEGVLRVDSMLAARKHQCTFNFARRHCPPHAAVTSISVALAKPRAHVSSVGGHLVPGELESCTERFSAIGCASHIAVCG